MKKVFKFMAIAAIAFGLTMNVACKGDEEEEGGGNGGNNTPVENPDNLPVTIDENFDGGLGAWTIIDADGDGSTWVSSADAMAEGYGHEGSTACALSKSYDNSIGALTPDNYLVSEKLWIKDGTTLTWYVAAQDANYPQEHYSVEIGKVENNNWVKEATLFEETFSGSSKDQTGWYQRSVDMSQYKGKAYQIAFRHHDCTDMFYLLIDDVKLQ